MTIDRFIQLLSNGLVLYQALKIDWITLLQHIMKPIGCERVWSMHGFKNLLLYKVMWQYESTQAL